MDFWDLTKLLFRRWFISVPLMLLTLGGTFYTATHIKPDYVGTSYVQLVPPSSSTRVPETQKKIVRNPWLDTGLNSLAKAALLTVQDALVAEQLKAAGFSSDYTITLDNQLPTVTIEVTGASRDEASRTTDELINRFTASALALQREFKAPAEQIIATRRLDLGDNIVQSNSRTKRALVAIFGAGLLISVGTTVACDALLRRRERRREDAAASPAAAVAAPPPGPAGTAQPAAPAPQLGKPDAQEPGKPGKPAEPAGPVPARSAGDDAASAKAGARRFEETVRLQTAAKESDIDSTVVIPPFWVKQDGQAEIR